MGSWLHGIVRKRGGTVNMGRKYGQFRGGRGGFPSVHRCGGISYSIYLVWMNNTYTAAVNLKVGISGWVKN